MTTESATVEETAESGKAGETVTGADNGGIKEDRPVVIDGDATTEEQASEEKTTESSSTEKEDGSI